MSELTFEQKQDHYHKIRRSITWPACAWKGSIPNRPTSTNPCRHAKPSCQVPQHLTLMLDKYGVGQDPYCYPGSSILRNRLDLLDEARLHQAERELSEIAVGNLPLFPPPYDLDRLQHIHRILFGDIYDWAGELRSVNIQKGDTLFCTPERIPPEAAKIVRHMQDANWYVGATQADLVRQIAEAYGDLNVIHPFREEMAGRSGSCLNRSS